MVNPWPPEKCALLAKLWDSGASFPVMCELLGVSGNSTISAKARRMGLAKRRGAPNGFGRRLEAQADDAQPRQPRYKTVPMPPWDRAPPGAPGVLDLRDGDCRFPLDGDDGYKFCAQPAIIGLPYCAAHAARAYHPERMKKGAP
jgi:GcrA cell cycle regulator